VHSSQQVKCSVWTSSSHTNHPHPSCKPPPTLEALAKTFAYTLLSATLIRCSSRSSSRPTPYRSWLAHRLIGSSPASDLQWVACGPCMADVRLRGFKSAGPPISWRHTEIREDDGSDIRLQDACGLETLLYTPFSKPSAIAVSISITRR
jgi:hypothetical protein